MSMYYNNQASIYISKKLVFHERTKYIEVDCHFIRDAVSRKMISTLFSPSSEELVDIFTKHIPLRVFFS